MTVEENEITVAGSAAGRDALLVALGAALLLAAFAAFFEPGRLHINQQFNDQAGYVTTARILAERGELRSGLLYPSQIDEPRWRQYMPGHYGALAGAYVLFGWSVFSSLLPCLLAFVLGTVGVYWIGARIYGRRAGLWAALLFALFPGNLAYAFTAMAESTFVAAAITCLALATHVPRKLLPYATPLLLILPFLFRETGALYVIPLCALFLGVGRHPKLLILGSFLLSVGVLLGVNAWQLATGKGTIPMSWVVYGKFNYRDATFGLPTDLSPGDWFSALAGNAGRNLGETWNQLTSDPLQSSVTGLACVLILTAVAVTSALKRRARDPFAMGAATLAVLILLMTYVLYDVQGQKAMRTALFTLAPSFIVTGSWLATCCPGARKPKLVFVGALVLASIFGVHAAGHELTDDDAIGDEGTRLLEEWGHDDTKLLLVHPFLVNDTLNYAVEHYPVSWAIIPQNNATFARILQQYPVGTLILSTEALRGQRPPELFQGGPLRLFREVEIRGKDYLVYKLP